MTKYSSRPDEWKNESEYNDNQSKYTEQDNKNIQNLSQIELAYRFYKDYKSKTYTGISKFSIMAIMLGLAYIISPIDFIPDFSIPFVGFIDDAAISALVYKKFKSELEKYKIWLMNR